MYVLCVFDSVFVRCAEQRRIAAALAKPPCGRHTMLRILFNANMSHCHRHGVAFFVEQHTPRTWRTQNNRKHVSRQFPSGRVCCGVSFERKYRISYRGGVFLIKFLKLWIENWIPDLKNAVLGNVDDLLTHKEVESMQPPNNIFRSFVSIKSQQVSSHHGNFHRNYRIVVLVTRRFRDVFSTVFAIRSFFSL